MSLLDGQPTRADPDRDRRTGHFVSANNGYRTRQKRVLEALESVKASYDVSNPADMAIAAIASLHLCDAELARSRVARVRATNAAVRLLKQLTRKPPKSPSIDEVLKGGR
jgi:hypothetical protein